MERSSPVPPARKPPLGERLKALFAEYGPLAIAIYLVIFVVVLAGFAVAIRFGVQVEGTAGAAGTLGAAWLATKLTQPLRIAAALALTPIVAALRARLGGAGERRGPTEAGGQPPSMR